MAAGQPPSGNGLYVHTSEVIDLIDPSKKCTPLPDIQDGVSSSAGVMIGGNFLMCGGETSEERSTKNCYVISHYDSDVKPDILKVASRAHAVVEIQDRMLLTGGFSKSSTQS